MTEPQPKRIPIGEALPDIEIYPLPEGEVPVAVFTLIKLRDADGEPSWLTRVTENYNRMEFLGALISYTDNVRRDEAADWGDDDDEAPHSHADVDT